MDLDALYEVLDGSVQVQVYSPALDDKFEDGIIFEGTMWDSYSAVEDYKQCWVYQIEVDDHGKLYIGIEA